MINITIVKGIIMRDIISKFFSIKQENIHVVIKFFIFKIKYKSKKLILMNEIANKDNALKNCQQEKFFMQREIYSLLKNYKNFVPKTNKIKIYLLNDTSRDINHLGSYIVQENIKKLCNKYNAEIYYSDSCFPFSQCDENYIDIIKHCDLVIFNGEGTLHDSAGINLFKKCEIAKKLDKKVVLINTVWQNNSEKYEQLLNYIDLISCRESRSYNALPHFAKDKAFIVPDIAFYGNITKDKIKNDDLIFTDSVLQENTKILEFYAKKFNKKIYYMTGPIIENCLNEEIYQKMSQNSKIITGRFHALVLGIKYGIPTFCIPSNTHKIEGLLEDVELTNYYIDTIDDFEQKIINFINSNHDDFIEKSYKYYIESQTKIEKLFKYIFDTFVSKKGY